VRGWPECGTSGQRRAPGAQLASLVPGAGLGAGRHGPRPGRTGRAGAGCRGNAKRQRCQAEDDCCSAHVVPPGCGLVGCSLARHVPSFSFSWRSLLCCRPGFRLAMPGSWTGVQAAARTAGCSGVRGGERRAPGDSGPIQGFATRVCAGQGSDDPFSSGRSRSAGTLRLPVGSGMAVAGVITTRAAHRRLTGSRLDGIRWGMNKVPGQDCRPRAAVAACPVPGAGLGGSYVPGERAGRGSGNGGAGAWPG